MALLSSVLFFIVMTALQLKGTEFEKDIFFSAHLQTKFLCSLFFVGVTSDTTVDRKNDKAANVLYMSKYLTFIMGDLRAFRRLMCLFTGGFTKMNI